jgi:hypothetical protein
MSDIVERLQEIAEQYKCPWGDPGSNPDYFSVEDYEDILKAAAEIEQLELALKIALGLDDGSEPNYEGAARRIEAIRRGK